MGAATHNEAAWHWHRRSLRWEDPLERKWQLTPVFLPGENPMDRGAWWAIDHGVTELDTTEHARAHTHTHTHGPAVLPRPCLWVGCLLRVALLQASTRSPLGLTVPWQDYGQPLLHFHRSPPPPGGIPPPAPGRTASLREQSLQQLFCSCWLSVWVCSRHLLGNVGKK